MSQTGLPFVHLRCRSAYSLLEGAVDVAGLSALAVHYQMPALGLTDSNNLFGALEFSETLSAAGVQPLIGLTLALGDTAATSDAKTAIAGTIALLAASEQGYLNLMALSSKAFLDVDPAELPHVSWEDVCARAPGLIALSGGFDGLANQALHQGQTDRAEAHLEAMAKTFGDNFFVEIQRHGRPEEALSEAALTDWAGRRGVPVVASNEPYFAKPGQHQAHDALMCIAQRTVLADENRHQVTAEHYFKSGRQMRARFDDQPEWLANTARVAMRCHFRPRTRPPILPGFTRDSGTDEAEELARQARQGLQERLAVIELAAEEKDYWDRLEHELKIINQMGFPGYFLIVADFIKWAKQAGIPVGPGRGSGAGSLVAWALTITDLDPLRFGLLFERFLNPERVSMPDFDIDFCQERRGEVIEYVREKYGHDRVAQIITFGTLQSRAVLRDVGRVMQLPLGQVDRLAKLMPANPANPVSLKEAIASEPALQKARDEEEGVAELLRTALELEGLYRNASTHAAGVVIGDRPLVELAPLYRDPRSDIPATQFNMKWAEKAGLVKFDFLGLKTLTVIDRAVSFIAQSGEKVDIAALPLDDKKTFALLSTARTVGIFQLESAGMRDILRKARPDCLEDIIAIVALYRPGPMENIPKYIACKHGREQPLFLHEMINPITAQTYGVIIYQEQVMQIAQVLAGFSLGEADVLRRAMGKKIKSEMHAQRTRFVEGAAKNGVDNATAQHIFDLVDKFAGYGFNKSHSAAYALVSYQTAWLKAHYPVPLLAAMMSLDYANTDKLVVFVHEARRMGIKICGPDINRSEADFSVQDGKIVYGLGAVRNVGLAAMQHVVAERRSNGPFADLFDFASRIDPKALNKRALENLARAGAFDCLEPNRNKVLQAAPSLLAHATHAARERQSKQAGLFGNETAAIGRAELADAPAWEASTRLREELAAMGFYFSGHPMDAWQQSAAALGVTPVADLAMQAGRRDSYWRLAAQVQSRQIRTGQRGRRFAFVTLSDASGECEIMVPEKLLDEARKSLEPGTAVLATVRCAEGGGDSRLHMLRVQTLVSATAKSAGDLLVVLDSSKQAGAVKTCLQALDGRKEIHKSPLRLAFKTPDGCLVEVKADGLWPADEAARKALKSLPGVEDARALPA